MAASAAGTGARPATRAALVASLLLHALLLAWPLDQVRRRAAHPTPRSAPTLRLTLLPAPALRVPAVVARMRTPTAAPPANSPRPTTRSPQHPRTPSQPATRPDTAGAAAPPAPPDDAQGAPARMALDPDALRAQVRDVVRRPEAASTMLAPGPAPEHVAGAFDRPRLDALARRVGRPSQVAGERRLPDGSWHIRFAGGVCMRIPRDMPAQLGNAFGENIALPSTCTD